MVAKDQKYQESAGNPPKYPALRLIHYAGTLPVGRQNITIRSMGNVQTLSDLENLQITTGTPQPVRIKDVASTFDSTNIGNYCSSGGMIDLRPYLKKDNISTSVFPASSVYYTSYKGVQCALPMARWA